MLRNARMGAFDLAESARLRAAFPAATAALDDIQLLESVTQTRLRAESYGLASDADLARFLNLAVVFGWDFDHDPERTWMRRMLTDPTISSPSERLRLLTAAAIRRLEIEEHNRRLRATFGVGVETAPVKAP